MSHARPLLRRLQPHRRLQLLALALALSLLGLAALAAARASAYIYYFENGANSRTLVGRANLDGSHANNHWADNGFGLEASDGSELYWGRAPSTDQFGYSNADGGLERSNIAGKGMHEIISNFLGDVEGIVGGHIYLLEETAGSDGHTYIARANLDGSGLTTLIDLPKWANSSEGGDGGPTQLATSGGYIYWYDRNRIGRADLNGGGVNDRYITGVGGGLSYGFAADGGHLYWTLALGMGQGVIARVNLDGSGMNKNFLTGLSLPQSVAVAAGHIYWTQGAPNDRSVRRARLDGHGIQTLIKAKTTYGLIVDDLGGSGGKPPKKCRASKKHHRHACHKAKKKKKHKRH